MFAKCLIQHVFAQFGVSTCVYAICIHICIYIYITDNCGTHTLMETSWAEKKGTFWEGRNATFVLQILSFDLRPGHPSLAGHYHLDIYIYIDGAPAIHLKLQL